MGGELFILQEVATDDHPTGGDASQPVSSGIDGCAPFLVALPLGERDIDRDRPAVARADAVLHVGNAPEMTHVVGRGGNVRGPRALGDRVDVPVVAPRAREQSIGSLRLVVGSGIDVGCE